MTLSNKKTNLAKMNDDSKKNENCGIEFSEEIALPTRLGIFKAFSVKDDQGKEHMVVFKGEVRGKSNVLVRIHSECLTAEALGSLRCDCREQLEEALSKIEQSEGVVIYLRQEGRGIGLFNKVQAYYWQDKGLDTVEANRKLGLADDLRGYKIAADILKYLNINSIRLLTNNPEKLKGIKEYGIDVVARISTSVFPNKFNQKYLKVKEEKMDHLFPLS